MTRIGFKTAWFDLQCLWTLFITHREKIQTFRERGNLKYLYANELNKPYFAHDSHLQKVRI